MALLEEITPGVSIKGLLPGGSVTIVSVKRHGSTSVELVYQDASGRLGSELLYDDDVASLEIAAAGLPWRFDADGALFRLASEAYRIRLAYLFDPLLAVHTSRIEPLPHQITAVYETMLSRQPLRYLLADDPGAGKTIMTGLLIKELVMRGDLRRCLIVAPGNLVEQWQDELSQRFSLVFDILTNDRLEASASGNAFVEMPLCIARLDKLSRSAEAQARLSQSEWDLVVVDEAHKMSATFSGGEAKYTRRYRLGELLGRITRHLVLLTATPHNGKEEDFQLFLRLLDADRFEGLYRADHVNRADRQHGQARDRQQNYQHSADRSTDAADLMRHLVKEQLYTFEGRPLFPERYAYTIRYRLSGLEDALYRAVTDYVRQEFNRAEALGTGRKGTVGFALTTLQRRLASSPEAIYQSLRRRRERLERRVQEARQQVEQAEQVEQGASHPLPHGQGASYPLPHGQGGGKPRPYNTRMSDSQDAPVYGTGDPRGRPGGEEGMRPGGEEGMRPGGEEGMRPGGEEGMRPGGGAGETRLDFDLPALSEEELDDLEDAPGAELEEAEERLVDAATAARTIAELEAEIARLAQLEALAQQVRRSGSDSKWESLASLLHERAEMFDAEGQRRKLVIFTEHRDTLTYLAGRIRTLLGREETVVCIHGGMNREARRAAQEAFTQDKEVQMLLATDAAGEGINLQRAHLLVNYDLPWNPNRIEQRFGRIHRIGQTEVCHLWNLVAAETREGEVYATLLAKLEEERAALGGQVFDVLGEVFDQRPLRELMVEAIRYGDRPDVRARLTQVVDQALDRTHLQALLDERALTHEVMDRVRVFQVREEMERTAARRLQPHYIAAFFLDAFRRLGGRLYEREAQRYEITHVPIAIRNRLSSPTLTSPTSHMSHARAVILPRYERVVFEKERISLRGKPEAALLCPGHPLLDATLDLVLEQQRALLSQGTMLVDPQDMGEEPRVLFYLEHAIQDGSTDSAGKRREVSRQLQFLELDAGGHMHAAGYAPFLDYRPLREEEQPLAEHLRALPWLQGDLEEQARSYAITELVPRHLSEVRRRREAQIDKTLSAVNERLTSEISYWDNRAVALAAQEAAGKPNARLNAQQAHARAEDLLARLERRLAELEQERKLSPLPPIVVGGVLVIPQGLLARLPGRDEDNNDGNEERQASEEDARLFAHETARIERLAMEAVMQRERELGYQPRDVSADKCGYDIESRVPESGRLRFIEVKGRAQGTTTVTVTVTRNEILTALNQPDDFILALVLVDGEDATMTHYLSRPFHAEPDFGATSVNYEIRKLLQKGMVV